MKKFPLTCWRRWGSRSLSDGVEAVGWSGVGRRRELGTEGEGRGRGGGNDGGWEGKEEGRRREGEGGVRRWCSGDPLLPASLPASGVPKVGIVLQVHKSQCAGKGLVLARRRQLVWVWAELWLLMECVEVSSGQAQWRGWGHGQWLWVKLNLEIQRTDGSGVRWQLDASRSVYLPLWSAS